MENLSDVEVEDIGDETFEFDGRPYVFEPEYTDEELLAPENVRAERERRRERNRQWRLQQCLSTHHMIIKDNISTYRYIFFSL